MQAARKAVLYRMVTPEHTCPYGLKAKDLLERQGFEVEDHLLTDRAGDRPLQGGAPGQVDAADLHQRRARRRLRRSPAPLRQDRQRPEQADLHARHRGILDDGTHGAGGEPRGLRHAVHDARGRVFIAFSMCVLALLKLQDVEIFSSMFLGYDLLGQRWVRYAYAYPFLEASPAS